MTFTDSREKPLLDKTWQRVVSFNEAGPSSKRQEDVDVMEIDNDDDNDEEEEEGGGEWEYEEEQELITLDLGPDSKRLVQMSQQYSIAGLETETPYLQLGNLMFQGTWDKLIGTEIILKDEVDLSKKPAEQHRLWPLPASNSDRKYGHPPSTTRKRILFKQAVNMVAREAALVPPDDHTSQPTLWRQAPALQEAKTGLITEKGWVWVRGRGWMRKEDTILLPQKATATTTGQSRDQTQEEEQEREEAEEQERRDADDEEGSNEENDQTNEDKKKEKEENRAISTEQGNPSKKKGIKRRQKMSPDERIRYMLLRTMRNVKKARDGPANMDERDDEEGEGEEEEEEADLADETLQTNAAEEDEKEDDS